MTIFLNILLTCLNVCKNKQQSSKTAIGFNLNSFLKVIFRYKYLTDPVKTIIVHYI